MAKTVLIMRLALIATYFGNSVLTAINWGIFYDHPTGRHLGFAVFSTSMVYFVATFLKIEVPK